MLFGETRRLATEAKTEAATATGNATAALARIDAHEQICTERQGHIIADLKEIKDFLKRVVWAILAGAVILLYNTLRQHGAVP